MNREIKFRAWDKYGNRMLSVSEVMGSQALVWFTDIQYELMQYTGLKDKNGQEIYEGDIVAGEFNGNGAREYTGYPERGVVQMVKGSWVLGSEYGGTLLSNIDNAERIGNIYENPELVK